MFDRRLPGEVHVEITQCGPTQVFLSMQTPVGRIFVVETVTPMAPMQLRAIHAVYAPASVPRVFAKAVLLYVPVPCGALGLPLAPIMIHTWV